MVLPARLIRTPKAKRKNQSKKKDSVAAALSKLHAREAQASSAFLNDAHADPPPSDANDPITDPPLYHISEDQNWTDDENANDFESRPYISFRERTQREQKQWKVIFPLMFPEFMKCSKKTFQWGDEDLWKHDWKDPCSCSGQNVRERSVDVVDISCWWSSVYCTYERSSLQVLITSLAGRNKITVKFCACKADSVRLLLMGFIGGTAKNPVTAYSIRLLRLFHMLWKKCWVRLTPFCLAIEEFLDARNPIILSASGDRVSSICLYFGLFVTYVFA